MRVLLLSDAHPQPGTPPDPRGQQLRDELARCAPHIQVDLQPSLAAAQDQLKHQPAQQLPELVLAPWPLASLDDPRELLSLNPASPDHMPPVLLYLSPPETRPMADVSVWPTHAGIFCHHSGLTTLVSSLEKVCHQAELAREKAALLEANSHLHHILAATQTVLFKLHFQAGHMQAYWVSANIGQLVGYSPGEVQQPEWWHTHVHPEDYPGVSAAQADFLVQGTLQREYRIRRRDGSYIWIRDRLNLLRDSQGQPVEVVGTWADITQDKEASLLSQAHARVRSLIFDGAPLATVLDLIILQLEGIFPRWRGAVLLRREENEELYLAAAPRLTPRQQARLLALQQLPDTPLAAVQASDAPTCLLTVWQDARLNAQLPAQLAAPEPGECPDDSLSLCCQLLRDSQEQVLGMFCFLGTCPVPDFAEIPLLPQLQARLTDFAPMAALAVERVRADQHLRQAAAVLASTQDGIVITDLEPTIVSVNPAWCEMTGYSRAEALGRNPSLLKSDLQGPGFYQSMWNDLATQGQWQGEIWNRRKNGETYPQFLSISTVRDSRGQPSHYVGVTTDLSRLRQSEEERERLTHYDPLTQLPNRLLALSRLNHAIEQAERDGHSIGVICLDLDHFKNINDSFSHPVGDQVLQALALRLKGRLLGKDSLARLGGDEFLIILERLDSPDDAARISQGVLDMLTQPMKLPDEREIYVGASLGISIYPQDGESAHELIQHADTALNQAKHQGRSTFCFYTSELSQQVRQRLAMELQMRRALERGEFSLHYQPQVDIRSGQVNGVEALMRWDSPELGRVPPGQFIPVAEQSGLILAMGAWVLEAACRQNKAWQDEGLTPLVISVNVSVRQFKSRELVQVVRHALQQSGLSPHYLEIELTESAFLSDGEEAIHISQQLHQMGVRLSLDDFGTGYSSLAYLSRFPFDKIKIDQSFVADIASNPTNAAIANATIALAESLHMSVLAEGVETESQLNFLRQRGCASMQGFLFSRALGADEFAALLRESRQLPAAPDAAEHQLTLLLLDDEPNILRALQRLLRPEGYKVFATTSPHEAFDLLAQHPVQVIVSDQRMPEMSGTEFLSRVKELYPDTIRIVLSGYSEIETITEAVNRGAIYKFLTKPWDDEALREDLREAFRASKRKRN